MHHLLGDREPEPGAALVAGPGAVEPGEPLEHNGDHVRGQVLVGSLAAGVAAYVAVRFLARWFETRTLVPFAVYGLVFGIAMILATTL